MDIVVLRSVPLAEPGKAELGRVENFITLTLKTKNGEKIYDFISISFAKKKKKWGQKDWLDGGKQLVLSRANFGQKMRIRFRYPLLHKMALRSSHIYFRFKDSWLSYSNWSIQESELVTFAAPLPNILALLFLRAVRQRDSIWLGLKQSSSLFLLLSFSENGAWTSHKALQLKVLGLNLIIGSINQQQPPWRQLFLHGNARATVRKRLSVGVEV